MTPAAALLAPPHLPSLPSVSALVSSAVTVATHHLDEHARRNARDALTRRDEAARESVVILADLPQARRHA